MKDDLHALGAIVKGNATQGVCVDCNRDGQADNKDEDVFCIANQVGARNNGEQEYEQLEEALSHCKIAPAF